MERQERWALVAQLVSEMRENGGWAGETHIQKGLYFLQDLLNLPSGYDFILYKHGPYSFDLHDDLGRMRANLILDIEPHLPYGPSFDLGRRGKHVVSRGGENLSRFGPHIRFVADSFGDKDVRTLEGFATALYVKNENPDGSPRSWGDRVMALKPHISLIDAQTAITSVSEIEARAAEERLFA